MRIKEKIDNITYTCKHWYYYQKTAKRLGAWAPRHLLHDVDKIFMYLIYSKDETRDRHRKNSRHHVEHPNPNYLDVVIDWECARFTKPDKALNAHDTCLKFYPETQEHIMPIITKLNINNKK